ncbi:MAG: DUF4965 domain-containing protein, partial [Clostridia bacterium]|nr:DUF4965 domain-containing protein [Clostridia bacterium]
MEKIHRLPALPLVANDPYFSIWCPADTLTDADSVHWSGARKPLSGTLTIDGRAYRFLGAGGCCVMETVAQRVTPTMTVAALEAGGVRLTVRFITPALPDNLDILSTPITLIDFMLESTDGKPHETALRFTASDSLCYDGEERPPMLSDAYAHSSLNVAYTGQTNQKLLCHSGDHITMDWGYLYLASDAAVLAEDRCLALAWNARALPREPARTHALLGYDDVVSILYFGTPCKAWYARAGKTLAAALVEFHERYEEIVQACETLDNRILEEATALGGEDYAILTAASWRHTFAAHKLIATPKGGLSLLSKENDSNGCIGTVDISYPSIPIFLKYCPSLANALCAHVLEFASMPVWTENFAPHDVGRYPIVGGQVYASLQRKDFNTNGRVYPPYYLYPAGKKVYDSKYQMPVEECGNMLIMLQAAAAATGDLSLATAYRPLLDTWANYLLQNGEDPGEQLCTDDFAGHMARNANLSAKAIVGLACYARLISAMGDDGAPWALKAKEMADHWYMRVKTNDATALTFDGAGWSQK